MVTKACLSLVKRCKPCQKNYNKEQVRNRYRKLKGIDLDKPIQAMPKKKKEKKEKKEKISKPKADDSIISAAQTPEEKERRRKAVEKLFALSEDSSTVDDWKW